MKMNEIRPTKTDTNKRIQIFESFQVKYGITCTIGWVTFTYKYFRPVILENRRAGSF